MHRVQDLVHRRQRLKVPNVVLRRRALEELSAHRVLLCQVPLFRLGKPPPVRNKPRCDKLVVPLRRGRHAPLHLARCPPFIPRDGRLAPDSRSRSRRDSGGDHREHARCHRAWVLFMDRKVQGGCVIVLLAPAIPQFPKVETVRWVEAFIPGVK